MSEPIEVLSNQQNLLYDMAITKPSNKPWEDVFPTIAKEKPKENVLLLPSFLKLHKPADQSIFGHFSESSGIKERRKKCVISHSEDFQYIPKSPKPAQPLYPVTFLPNSEYPFPIPLFENENDLPYYSPAMSKYLIDIRAPCEKQIV